MNTIRFENRSTKVNLLAFQSFIAGQGIRRVLLVASQEALTPLTIGVKTPYSMSALVDYEIPTFGRKKVLFDGGFLSPYTTEGLECIQSAVIGSIRSSLAFFSTSYVHSTSDLLPDDAIAVIESLPYYNLLSTTNYWKFLHLIYASQ